MTTTTLKDGDLVEYENGNFTLYSIVEIDENGKGVLNIIPEHDRVDGDMYLAEWVDNITFERVITVAEMESFRYI